MQRDNNTVCRDKYLFQDDLITAIGVSTPENKVCVTDSNGGRNQSLIPYA